VFQGSPMCNTCKWDEFSNTAMKSVSFLLVESLRLTSQTRTSTMVGCDLRNAVSDASEMPPTSNDISFGKRGPSLTAVREHIGRRCSEMQTEVRDVRRSGSEINCKARADCTEPYGCRERGATPIADRMGQAVRNRRSLRLRCIHDGWFRLLF
jgi:hypothetical protein